MVNYTLMEETTNQNRTILKIKKFRWSERGAELYVTWHPTTINQTINVPHSIGKVVCLRSGSKIAWYNCWIAVNKVIIGPNEFIQFYDKVVWPSRLAMRDYKYGEPIIISR